MFYFQVSPFTARTPQSQSTSSTSATSSSSAPTPPSPCRKELSGRWKNITGWIIRMLQKFWMKARLTETHNFYPFLIYLKLSFWIRPLLLYFTLFWQILSGVAWIVWNFGLLLVLPHMGAYLANQMDQELPRVLKTLEGEIAVPLNIC